MKNPFRKESRPCLNCGCLLNTKNKEMVCDAECLCHTEYLQSVVLEEIFSGRGGDL